MHQSLAHSLKEVVAEHLPPKARGQLDSVLADSPAEPLLFGAYFDLVLQSSDSEADSSQRAQEATHWLLRFLNGDLLDPHSRTAKTARQPMVATLSGDFYHEEELRRWMRWLDTEPDNALAMAPLDEEVLQVETEKIQRALALLGGAAPELADELGIIVREIVVARPSGAQRLFFRGVSSFTLWGAIAVNSQAHPHWSDYVSTLVHETAHSLLFALARSEPLVLNDPELRYESPLRDDARPMDGIFHGAFVSAREAYAMTMCIEFLSSHADTESSLLRRAFQRTLDANVQDFWSCCDQIHQHGELSHLGREILMEVQAYMRTTFPREG